MRGTKVAVTEGQWLLSKSPECSAPKNPDNCLKAHACSPYIPPTLCISITFVMSLNDVMIVCFPLSLGKTLHMHRRAMLAHLCIHQHPHQPISMFPTATHGPSHQFSIPNFEPVTYIGSISPLAISVSIDCTACQATYSKYMY